MKYKDLYVFPAVFEYADDGINVRFPDLDGALTCGEDEAEALFMAKDCLEGYLYFAEKDEEQNIPEASAIKDIELKENEAVVMIRANMVPVRDEMANKAVKKTLSIPSWLNEAAIKQKLNFSSILKTALMNELDINQSK